MLTDEELSFYSSRYGGMPIDFIADDERRAINAEMEKRREIQDDGSGPGAKHAGKEGTSSLPFKNGGTTSEEQWTSSHCR